VRDLRRYDDQPHRRAKGDLGERAAELWLEGQGYRIVARNVFTRAGELDLVALDGEVLCFIEIKSRATDEFGPAIAAVGAAKRRRISRAAAHFLARNRSQRACRFDVLGLDREGESWRFTLVRDAFAARF
jgi:putative endonuclease